MDFLEKLDIAQKLQKHHYFFRAFWDIGSPIVGKFSGLDTAAIQFDKDGNSIQLLIDEDFWKSLDEHTKLFLICHELLHILLNHGFRFKEYIDTEHFNTMNIAADVVINELLVHSFGFDRELLNNDLSRNGCWLNTVFDDTVKSRQSTEYYFNLLKNNTKNRDDFYNIDSHNMLADDSEEIIKELKKSGVLDGISEEINEKLNSLAGEGILGKEYTISSKIKIKKKWETVIKKWESKNIKEDVFLTERWERINPRYSYIMDSNNHLPTESHILDERICKDRLNVFFFLDTSGSCINLKDRFFTAAKSLNPKKFKIRLFCFDTKVVETDIKGNKVYGGGGTSFSIIESKIQNIVTTEKIKYPDAVWIITDGYGNKVVPQKPKKWFWFLTNNFTTYIPKESNIFRLSDYE